MSDAAGPDGSARGIPPAVTGSPPPRSAPLAAPAGPAPRPPDAVLDALPGMVYRMLDDRQWTVEYVSAGCRELTGWGPEDLLANRRISYEEVTHPADRARVRAAIHAAIAEGRPFDVRYRIVTAAGVERWVWERGRGVAGADPVAIEGFVQDVTEHVHAEEQLRRRETMLEEAERIGGTGSWEWDARTRHLAWSRSLFRLYGFEPADEPPPEAEVFARIVPEDRAPTDGAVRGAVRAGTAFSREHRVRLPDGTTRVLHSTGHVQRDETGTVIRAVGAVQDVTERALAADTMRVLADASAVLGASLEEDRLLDGVAQVLLARFGGACVIDLVADDGGLRRRLFAPAHDEAFAAWLRAYVASLDPRRDGALVRRVLESRRAVLIADVDDAYYAAAPLTREQVAAARAGGLRSLLAVPLVARGTVLGLLTFFTEGADARRFTEADRELAAELAMRAALAVENARLYAAARAELEERRHVEAALRESEERFRTVVRATSDVVWDWDVRDDSIWWSESLDEVFGLRDDDTVRDLAWWASRVHPDDLAATMAGLHDAVARANAGGSTAWSSEYRFRRGDGTYAVVTVRGFVLCDVHGRARRMVGALLDVTGQRLLDERLRQSAKMEAVGRLAGGVAHDFNNLLTVIGGSTEFLLQACPPGDPRHADVVEVRRAAERAGELTRQLLTFSRRQVVQPRRVELNALVRDAERMLRRLIGEDVRLATTLDPDVPAVRADPGQLEQALVNLVVNARDAMPGGGALTIETRRARVAPSGAPPERRPEEHAALVVRDTGTGMDAATRDRLFEPFFTTKEAGRGTGLGLATVFGVVRGAGGYVAVESAPGAGSTFTLYLPAAPPEATSHAPAAAPAGPSRGGDETVLVIEDDPRVRRLARRTLETRGYRVLEAGSAEEALALSDAHAARIDLVVSDVVLPERNGREVVELLEQRRPGLRALFMSGYTADALLYHRITESHVPFLEKPFTVERLLGAVRAALDADR